MSPDTPESRLGQLERNVAKLEQIVDDLKVDVRTLMPLVISHAEMRVQLAQVHTDIVQLRSMLETQQKHDRAVADGRVKDDRSFRRTLIGVGTAAVASPVVTWLLTGGPG